MGSLPIFIVQNCHFTNLLEKHMKNPTSQKPGIGKTKNFWFPTPLGRGYHLGDSGGPPTILSSRQVSCEADTVTIPRQVTVESPATAALGAQSVPSLSLGEGGEICLNLRGLRALEDVGWWWICGRGLVDCPRRFYNVVGTFTVCQQNGMLRPRRKQSRLCPTLCTSTEWKWSRSTHYFHGFAVVDPEAY